MTVTDIIGALHTLRGLHVLRQWDESCATGWPRVIRALEKMEGPLVELSLESGPLIARWRKEADQYMRQVEEARNVGIPHDQMLSMAAALRQCATELERATK